MGDLNVTANSTAPSSQAEILDTVSVVVGWVSFVIGLPANCLAIHVLYHQVKADNVTPIYVINLLASNAFSFLGRPPEQTRTDPVMATDVVSLMFYLGIITNVSFMTCLALETYVVVARPACYHHYSTIRSSALVSLVAWAAPFLLLALAIRKYYLIFSVFLLLPLPLLAFIFMDTCLSLCCFVSMSFSEKRRIVGMLALTLCNYTVLFLPFALKTLFSSLTLEIGTHPWGTIVNILLYLRPLVDPLFYIFTKTNVRDTLKAFPCCRKRYNRRVGSATVPTVSETVTRL